MKNYRHMRRKTVQLLKIDPKFPKSIGWPAAIFEDAAILRSQLLVSIVRIDLVDLLDELLLVGDFLLVLDDAIPSESEQQ